MSNEHISKEVAEDILAMFDPCDIPYINTEKRYTKESINELMMQMNNDQVEKPKVKKVGVYCDRPRK